MIQLQIQQALQKTVEQEFGLKLDLSEFLADHPTNEMFGDYSSNCALKVTKSIQKEVKHSPIQIANMLVEKLKKQPISELFEKIEAVHPGFINFTLGNRYLEEDLVDLVSREEPIDSQKQTLVEHTGPNTNKSLHIGHIRNATLGTAMLELLKSSGVPVVAANINNDRGIHIIKSMYGFLIHGRKTEHARVPYKEALEQWSVNPDQWHTPQSLKMKPDHFVGHYYVLGNNEYEDSEKQAEESGLENLDAAPYQQMQQMLVDWEAEEPLIRALWRQNNNWFYEGMHQTLRDYNIHSPNDSNRFFDKEWYESDIYKEGKDIIFAHLNNGVVQEFEDGHVEAVLEKYRLPNVVLLRKNKTSLYITQDIELMRKRIKEDQNKKVVILTDAGQNLRFEQLYAICESLEISAKENMIHIGYGTVRLPEGKMSSRKGTVITADWLLETAKAKALEKINVERSEYSDSEKKDIAQKVAVAAIKYGILKYNPLSNIIFDIDNSLAFEGETGPYLQYTYARASSVRRKYEERWGVTPEKVSLSHADNEERSLARVLQKHNDWVKKSANAYSPNYLCEYLFNVAQKYNAVYGKSQIVNEEQTEIREMRYMLTLKTAHVLKTGLNVLGIEAPEKM